MDAFVFFAVLLAAVMHAGWNAILRGGADRLGAMVILCVAQGAAALLLLPLFPLPAAEAWPWLLSSMALHMGYMLFLTRAYEHGELNQVYPLARGTAPLIVAVVGAVLLGETLTPPVAGAIAAIGFGVILMSFKGGAGVARLPPRALLYALTTAGFTAGYTLVDGQGARLSASPSSYVILLFLGDGILMLAYGLLVRGRSVLTLGMTEWRNGVIGGALSFASYWIAIWAFTQAPIALVAALRETSVLFAMLISAVLLREPASRWRWAAACLICYGVVLMRI